MIERDTLIDALEAAFPSPHLLDESGLRHTADALIAAGWRLVPTEGPAFDAMVERAAIAADRTFDDDAAVEGIDLPTWEQSSPSYRKKAIRAMAAALRAALGGDHG